MPCAPFTLPDGSRGIACTSRGRRPKCACGGPGAFQCDWKVPAKRSGTCDRYLCAACTYAPAIDKDLCPAHAVEWLARA